MQNELELCEKGKAKILAIALSHGGRYQTINCSSSGEGVRAPVLQNDQEPPALHTAERMTNHGRAGGMEGEGEEGEG